MWQRISQPSEPFSFLRLTGVPLGVLRRMVTPQTAVRLIASAVLSARVKFLAAGLFTYSALGLPLHPSGAEYDIIVAVGLAALLAIIAFDFPLLVRITDSEATRRVTVPARYNGFRLITLPGGVVGVT